MAKIDRVKLSFQELEEFNQRNQLYSFDEKRFKWLFYQNPFGEANFYCAFDKEKLVGTEILIPLEFIYQGDRFMTFLAVGSLIDKDYRGKGLWKQLLIASAEDSRENGGKAIWGPPNPNSLPVLQKHGNWQHICNVGTLRFFCGVNKTKSIPIQLIQTVLQGRNKIFQKKNKQLVSQPFKSCENVPTRFISIHKNNDYLKWRYVDEPQKVFHLQQLTDVTTGESCGFWVYSFSGRTLCIVDYFLNDYHIYLDDFIGIIQHTGFENDCYRIVIRENVKSLAFNAMLANHFQQRAEYPVFVNILDNSYSDILKNNHWDMNMGDEDINFTKGM